MLNSELARADLILRRWRVPLLIALVTALFAALVPLVARTFDNQPLGDFTVSFYRAANYLLRGESVYFNRYPNPLNEREYPPFNPVYVLYLNVPLAVFPLHIAEAMRMLLDLVGLAFLAYLTTCWARLGSLRYAGWLALAPWHSNMIFDGSWGILPFVGALLCFWAARRANGVLMGVGIWLLLVKPHIVALVILAALILAWRQKIFFRMSAMLVALLAISTLAYPSWLIELKDLYVERLAYPRLADSVLLLPAYPWSQLLMLAAGALFLIFYLWRSREPQPTLWLWAMLVTLSLVGALHTFLYDWMMLMLPLALLLRERGGLWFLLALYAYPFIWAVCALVFGIPVPPVTIVPAATLIALALWRSRLGAAARPAPAALDITA